jgi:hypothetical protein
MELSNEKYNPEEIKAILEIMLGDDVEGIFVAQELLDDNDDEMPIYSNWTTAYEIQETYCCKISCGCTKLVIIPRDKDYVIKLPITHIYEDEEITMQLDQEEDIFAEEKALYDSSTETLQNFILPNYYIGEYQGIPVFVQEKAEFDIATPLSEKVLVSDQIVSSIREETDFYSFSVAFVKDMVRYFGQIETKELIGELLDYEIVDLHRGNYGYTLEGKPCLIDIGGYREDRWAAY